MWAMADVDGMAISRQCYRHMLVRDGEGHDAPLQVGERSARALRDAVQTLRGRGVNLERWVNWVHYGA